MDSWNVQSTRNGSEAQLLPDGRLNAGAVQNLPLDLGSRDCLGTDGFKGELFPLPASKMPGSPQEAPATQ